MLLSLTAPTLTTHPSKSQGRGHKASESAARIVFLRWWVYAAGAQVGETTVRHWDSAPHPSSPVVGLCDFFLPLAPKGTCCWAGGELEPTRNGSPIYERKAGLLGSPGCILEVLR